MQNVQILRKVLPVNSEVLAHLKNIESPATDLPQVTDKLLSHNVVSSTPCPSGIRTRSFSGDM